MPPFQLRFFSLKFKPLKSRQDCFMHLSFCQFLCLSFCFKNREIGRYRKLCIFHKCFLMINTSSWAGSSWIWVLNLFAWRKYRKIDQHFMRVVSACRFLGTTQDSSSLMNLLYSMTSQLERCLKQKVSPPTEVFERDNHVLYVLLKWQFLWQWNIISFLLVLLSPA